MKRCTCCGTTTANDDIKFCHACGRELKEFDKCSYCSNVVHPIDKFCGFCGRPCDGTK